MSKSLIIIGCGPGGYATAEYAAKAGMTVTVFEKAEAGGTCLNRGCIPTKVYCHAATLALDNAKAAEWGLWQSTQPAIDFPKLHAHKDAVVAQLRGRGDTHAPARHHARPWSSAAEGRPYRDMRRARLYG